MDEKRLGGIYNKIAETVIETIPEEWEKIYLYGEIAEGVRKSYFYYYPKESTEAVYSHDITELFYINESEYDKLWYRLLDCLDELRMEFINNEQEAWTNLTFIFESSGKFKIDFSYDDLSNSDDYERHIIWDYKYLGLMPQDEDDKEFLQNYLKDEEERNKSV